MVLGDLLGPVGGPEEEIDEQSVRDRYSVGMLAPKRNELSPEEFDELPEGGSGPVEDGIPESTSPSTKTMFPSSFGVTFCVGQGQGPFALTTYFARWLPTRITSGPLRGIMEVRFLEPRHLVTLEFDNGATPITATTNNAGWNSTLFRLLDNQ